MSRHQILLPNKSSICDDSTYTTSVINLGNVLEVRIRFVIDDERLIDEILSELFDIIFEIRW